MSDPGFIAYMLLVGRDAAGADTNFPFGTESFYLDSFGHYVHGRIQRAGVWSDHCFGPGRIFGDMDISSTNVVLANPDGQFDSMRDYAFGYTTPVFALNPETYAGAPVASGNFGRQFTLLPQQPVFDYETISFSVRHQRALLDLPFMQTKYAGTNSGAPLAGIEGTANDLKGQPKPMVLGSVFNITPKLVNTSLLIYQVDRRGFITGYSLTVYDKRVALTAGADYVSQADMEANAPAAGQYRKWPAGGCFRLGSTPTGAITCDVTNPPLPSGDTSSTILNVIDAINYHYAPTNQSTGLASAWLTAPSVTVGIYLDREYTHMQACSEVLRSVGAYLFFDADENPHICHVTAPSGPLYLSGLNPVEIAERDILAGSIQQVIQGDGAYGLPIWRVNLNYKRNYTVMSASELAGAAAADIAFCEAEYRTVKAEDSAIKTQWQKATELTVTTLLTDATQAQAECDRLLALLKVRRQCFRLKVHGSVIRAHPQFDGASYRASDFQISCRVKVTMNRFGWDGGKTFFVIGVDRDMDADTYELTIWG